MPFTADQLTASLRELVQLTGLTRTLPAPMKLREWQVSCALCEDLLYQQQKYRELGPLLDRIRATCCCSSRITFTPPSTTRSAPRSTMPGGRARVDPRPAGTEQAGECAQDLARNRERLPAPATGAGAGLPAARAAVGRGLGRAHPAAAKAGLATGWRQAAILLALLLRTRARRWSRPTPSACTSSPITSSGYPSRISSSMPAWRCSGTTRAPPGSVPCSRSIATSARR